eukprot:PhM_4_TR10831/c0_g1_i1/m.9485
MRPFPSTTTYPSTSTTTPILVSALAMVVLCSVLFSIVMFSSVKKSLPPQRQQHGGDDDSSSGSSDSQTKLSFVDAQLRRHGGRGPDVIWRLERNHTLRTYGITVYAVVDHYSGFVLCLHAYPDWGKQTEEDVQGQMRECAVREAIGPAMVGVHRGRDVPLPKEWVVVADDIDVEAMFGGNDEESSFVTSEPFVRATASPDSEGTNHSDDESARTRLFWTHVFGLVTCSEDAKGGYITAFIKACRASDVQRFSDLVNAFPRQQWNRLPAARSGGATPRYLYRHGRRHLVDADDGGDVAHQNHTP